MLHFFIGTQIILVLLSSEESYLIRQDLVLGGAFYLWIAWEFVRCARPRDKAFLVIQQRYHFSGFVFLWRLLYGFLATDGALCSRRFCMVFGCIYSPAIKTSRYLFINCPPVNQVWVHFWQIVGMQDVIFFTHMLCFVIGADVSFSLSSLSPSSQHYSMTSLEGS